MIDEPKRVIGRPFQPGNPGGPGRKPGPRSRLGELFVSALLSDFEKNGIEAIELVRLNDPAVYINTIAKILPKEHTGSDGEPLFTGITVNFVK